MYPPAGVGVVRINRERDVLLNNQVLVPRGVGVWLPTHALHNVSDNWDHPDAFLPGASASIQG